MEIVEGLSWPKLTNFAGSQRQGELTMSKAQEARQKAWLKKREILKKAKFTDEEKGRWDGFLHQTWSTIGGDVEQAMEGKRITLSMIVEVTCDANYAEMYSAMTHDEYEFMSAI